MVRRHVPMFDADFPCICGSVVGIKTRLAIVQSQTGAEVGCRHCQRRYRVTEKGAYPIGKGSVLQPRSLSSTVGELGAPTDGAEVATLRFPQSGESSKLGPTDTPIWTMRLRPMRRSKKDVAEPTNGSGDTGKRG